MRKLALVTGAASGIGQGIAIALAKANYDVAINYSRNADGAEETARQITAAGAQVLVVKADVAWLPLRSAGHDRRPIHRRSSGDCGRSAHRH